MIVPTLPAAFAFFRSLPDHDGVRLLEEREVRRHRRLRPVLPQEPVRGGVHDLRRPRGVPQVHRRLPLLRLRSAARWSARELVSCRRGVR